MISLSKLTTGAGYAYYTAMTASGDERRRDDQELGDYYLETGTPEGRWIGRGCAGLNVKGVVREDQMKALFGEGRHPEADQIARQIAAEGGSAKDIDYATRLGRRPARFQSPNTQLARAIKDAEAVHQRRTGHAPSTDEARKIRFREGAKAYEDRFGHRHVDDAELGKFIAKELGSGSNSVAGYDLTFSPPKSVSVLWGLSDETTAQIVENAHQAAIEETVQFLEDNVIGSRAGAGGVAQIDVKGLVATAFRHYESRDGDPQLHDHVVIANRVQGTDGKWRTLDGSAIYRNLVNASEHYNDAVITHLSRAGFSFSARDMGPAKRPVMEVDGIDKRLLSTASKRSAAIRSRTAELVADYEAKHSRQPDRRTLQQLRQQATLETRAPKEQHRTLAQMRAEWADEARTVLREDAPAAAHDTEAMLGHALAQGARSARPEARSRAEAVRDGLDVIGAGNAVIHELSSRRSTWAERDLRAEVNRWIGRNDGWLLTDAQRQQILEYARDVASINLTPASEAPILEELRRADGTSIYEPRDRAVFTSSAMLDAEYRLVDAAREDAIPAASGATFDSTLAMQDVPLDDGQIALARSFACGDKALAVGIGPAGAGKTTAMRLAVEAIHADGGRVIGLSVAASAAAQLQDSTGADSTTLAQWKYHRDRAAEGAAVAPQFQLNSGDVILIDEAGMAATLDLDAIVTDARRAGAHVRLIGDDRQLQAVESGGALRMIASEAGAVELTAVHRFSNAAEAAASLKLREGDITWYESAGRIHSGRHDDLVDAMVRAWDRDDADGHDSLMMADTNRAVAELNGRAQQLRIDRGQVDLSTTARLSDSHSAGVGDRIVTRKVDRRLHIDGTRDCVKNGDVWSVRTVNEDGSLFVERPDGRTITLPAKYVRNHAQLAYASTVHRAQGRTVDNARALATSGTSREGLYVAMTRGRHGNDLFVATDDQPREKILERITRSERRDISARDAMLSEAERVDSAAELGRQHQDITERADHLRYSAQLREVLGDRAEEIISGDSRSAVDAALREAENRGYDTQRLIERHRNILDAEGVDDPSRLLSWRVRRDLDRGLEQATSTEHRPLREVPRERLVELLEQSEQRRAEARDSFLIHEARHSLDAKPITIGERTVPAWSDRVHGSLTKEEIAEQVHTARWLLDEHRFQETRAARTVGDLQRQWDAARRAGHKITDPRLQVLANDLHHARGDLEAIKSATREQHQDLAALRREQMIRRDMSARDWRLECVQRAMQRDAGLTDVEHVQRRTANVLDLEEAQRIYEREDTLAATIRAEARRREVEPGRAVTAPADGLPRWLVPDRGMDSRHMPRQWKENLEERRAMIRSRLLADGDKLAHERPAWTRELGRIPAEGRQRTRWHAAAGQIKAWRDLHRFTDPKRALPELTEVPERDRADLAHTRKLLKAPTPQPKTPTSPTLDLDSRIAAQRAAGTRGTALSAPQARAEEAMRRRLADQATQQRGPVQR